MTLKRLPKEGTQLRECLDLLVEAKGNWVSVSEIARVTHSTCAHNLPNTLKNSYGAIYVNKQWFPEGKKRSSYKLINWEEFLR